ncbi:MAG: ABC transporter permease [Gemmatimonadota bacterium]|nr:ABC transporter permease [Gemmatimonadota bacterium]
MSARNVWAVVRREYLQRVRSRWFVVSTVGGPVLLFAVLAVPAWFATSSDEPGPRIAVVDGTDALYERVADDFTEAGYTVEEVRWRNTVVDTLRRRAAEGEIGGFVMLDQFTLQSGDAVLYVNRRPTGLQRAALRSAIVRAALEVQLEQQGVDVEAMLAGGALDVQMLSPESAREGEPRFLIAYVGAFLLYMVILLHAVAVMRATLEEKTSRIVEVIISAMEPWHLMLGKVLGVGAVALTQLLAWTLTGALIVVSGLPTFVAGGGLPPAEPGTGGVDLMSALPGPTLLALFGGYFVFGFFIYSGLYAAVGAMCSSDDEAQQAQLPLVMFLIVPIVFVLHVIENPGAPLSVALSHFPLFTPILMWARIAGGAVPAWEIAVSFVVMAAAIVAIAWVAGRIYKVGILMTGKRPTLGELWRWVREA